MNDELLAGLESALTASPGNPSLWRLLVDGYRKAGRLDRLKAQVARAPATTWTDVTLASLVGEALLDAGDAASALPLAPLSDPAGRHLAARACLALDRREEGLAHYRAAVAANPTLEDPELAAALGARVREVATEGKGPRLRVIANDDTNEEDAARMLQPPQARVTFADVGGHAEVKEQIRKRIILPFQKPSLFQRFKKKAGGGILLYGPPGCGKTLLARATAGECNATFLSVAISDVLDMYIGESERKLHALFEKARASAPAVLFFDEVEALAGKRQFSREGSSAKLVSQFLAEMDGFSTQNGGVLVLGATNVPWAVDPAFRRPGRFDRVQFIPPPDQPARAEILALHLRERPVAAGIKVEALAARTSGFSGADLEHLVETAADHAIQRSLESGAETPISQEDLVAALSDVRATVVEWLTSARNYARYANEAGQYDDVLRWLEKHGRA